jgi:hypothetical protein
MPSSAQLQAPTPPTTPRHALAPSHAAPPSSAILISPTGLLRKLALILVCAILCAPAWAQRQQTTNSDQPIIPGVNNSNASPPGENSGLHRMAQRMAVERNIDRQKEIINDTVRLLQLAQQLNAEVSKSNKDTLSVSVVKKAEEIEKLAKSVKQKMRDGQ